MILLNDKGQLPTRNIRKPGEAGNLCFSTFNKNCSGLTSRSFEIPASAYCHPWVSKKMQPTFNLKIAFHNFV